MSIYNIRGCILSEERARIESPASFYLWLQRSLSPEITSCHCDIGLAGLVGIHNPSSGAHSHREREREKKPIPKHISPLVLIHSQDTPPAEIFNYHISTALSDNEDNCFIHFVKLK